MQAAFKILLMKDERLQCSCRVEMPPIAIVRARLLWKRTKAEDPLELLRVLTLTKEIEPQDPTKTGP